MGLFDSQSPLMPASWFGMRRYNDKLQRRDFWDPMWMRQFAKPPVGLYQGFQNTYPPGMSEEYDWLDQKGIVPYARNPLEAEVWGHASRLGPPRMDTFELDYELRRRAGLKKI